MHKLPSRKRKPSSTLFTPWNSSATSVVSSNLGAVNPAACRPDGTDADYFVMKSLGKGLTEEILHRLGGLLVLLSGRTNDKVFLSVLSYQPGRSNSDGELLADLANALDDFSLTAAFGWPQSNSIADETNSPQLLAATA